MTDENPSPQEPTEAAPAPAYEQEVAAPEVAQPAAAPAQWPAAPAPGGPAAPPVPPVPPSGYPSPYPAPGYTQGTAQKTSSNSIVALVLAVASWVVCPIVPAIVALVFASMASKEIAASGEQLGGRGMVTASRVVSWVNIGFWIALIVIGAFVAVIILIAGGLSNAKTT